MITLTEIDKNVFELKETIMGFTNTFEARWYWDLEKRLLSEKSDFPEGVLTRPLTDEDLERFEKYYKPLICRRVPI